MFRFKFKFLIVLSLGTHIKAQQVSPNPMFYFDPVMIMRSSAGLDGENALSLVYRNQWESLPGSPKMFQLNYSSPLMVYNGAYSIGILNESSGIHSKTSFSGYYQKVIPKNKFLAALGAGIHYDYIKADYSKIRTPDGNYNPGIDHQDPIISNKNDLNNSVLNIIISSQLRIPLIQFGAQWKQSLISLNKKDRFYKSANLLTVTLQKEFLWSNWTYQIIYLNSTDFKFNQEEFLVNGLYKDLYSIGLLWRGLRKSSLDAVGLQLSFRLTGGIWAAYTLEWPLNILKSSIPSATQQFGLKFEWNTKAKVQRQPIIYNPRW